MADCYVLAAQDFADVLILVAFLAAGIGVAVSIVLGQLQQMFDDCWMAWLKRRAASTGEGS